MQSSFGVSMMDTTRHDYPSDSMMDELSRQLAISDSIRRLSRGSSGQRAGNAMRIVKPTSASNSPQARMARRRTLIADGNIARRRGQPLDQAAVQNQMQSASPYTNYQDPIKRSSRPVSWHPSSHLQVQQQHRQQLVLAQQQHLQQPQQAPADLYQQTHYQGLPQYVLPTPMPYGQAECFQRFQNLPPTPAEYSAHNSPLSGYSPVSISLAAPPQIQTPPQYATTESWNPPQQEVTLNTYMPNSSPSTTEAFPSFSNDSSMGWSAYTQEGIHGGITPPTPQDLQPIQQHEAVAVPPEDSIPYEPLEEPEEEGEILVGMGLYDAPDKLDTDPWLDNYRTSTSQLLGTTYRKMGQGLKLEEAWEPPASDDEDDGQESSDERDADGEEHDAEEDTSAASNHDTQTWI